MTNIKPFTTVEYKAKDGKTYQAKKMSIQDPNTSKKIDVVEVYEKGAKPDKNGKIQTRLMTPDTFVRELSQNAKASQTPQIDPNDTFIKSTPKKVQEAEDDLLPEYRKDDNDEKMKNDLNSNIDTDSKVEDDVIDTTQQEAMLMQQMQANQEADMQAQNAMQQQMFEQQMADFNSMNPPLF